MATNTLEASIIRRPSPLSCGPGRRRKRDADDGLKQGQLCDPIQEVFRGIRGRRFIRLPRRIVSRPARVKRQPANKSWPEMSLPSI